jgi:hypothetical protein
MGFNRNRYDNYPPGTWAGDPNAPWNAPDLEPSDENYEEATAECWALLELDNKNIGPADLTIGQLLDMFNETLSAKAWDELNLHDLTDQMEATAIDHGIGAALMLVDDETAAKIKIEAQCWIDDRAYELASEVDY